FSWRVARAPTMLASAPSPKCACPRSTPGCSTKVRLTRSSNSRMRTICVYIQISLSLPRSFACIDASFLPAPPHCLRTGDLVAGVANVTEQTTHRHFCRFPAYDFQQQTFHGRVKLVVHLFCF